MSLNPKDAIGRAKPGLNFLPIEPLFEVNTVMQAGAAKYGAYNWRETAVSGSVYYNAIMRHLARWWEGDDTDEETGCHHLAHVMANCAILMDAMENCTLSDDRPMPPRPLEF